MADTSNEPFSFPHIINKASGINTFELREQMTWVNLFKEKL